MTRKTHLILLSEERTQNNKVNFDREEMVMWYLQRAIRANHGTNLKSPEIKETLLALLQYFHNE